METVIALIITIIIFATVAYALYWVCIKFSMPQPVLWICGALLLVIILYWLSQQMHLIK